MMTHYIVKIETIFRTIEYKVVDHDNIKNFEEEVIKMLEQGTLTLDTEEGNVLLLIPYNIVSVIVSKIN